jgi:hypothetical protein
MAHHRMHGSPLKGAIVGSLSGLVGTVLMTQFQIVWKKGSEQTQSRKKTRSESKKSEKEDSTMKTAEKLGEAAGYKLTKAERKRAIGFTTDLVRPWEQSMASSGSQRPNQCGR